MTMQCSTYVIKQQLTNISHGCCNTQQQQQKQEQSALAVHREAKSSLGSQETQQATYGIVLLLLQPVMVI